MQKKILIVADVLGMQNNGTTITINRLIDGLKKRGFKVLVVSPQKHDPQNGYFGLEKRNFFIFNKYVQKNGVCLGKPNKKLLKKLICSVDIVHIFLPFKVGNMSMRLCKKYQKPFTVGFHCPAEAVTVHLGLKNCKIANDIVYKYHYNHFYKHCPIIHCPSQFYANILRSKGYKNKIFVVSNGISDVFFCDNKKNQSNLFTVVSVGRLSLEKRQNLLVDAVAKSKYNKNIKLVLAGDGPTKQKLQKQCKKLANKPTIKYFSSKDLADVLKNCDLYVHCSDVEVEGMACLEGIASGLVPIISDSPKSATRDFALTQHCLFKNGNSDDLQQKIQYFFENPTQLEKHQKLYQNFAKNFTTDKVVDKMIQMFDFAIKEQK